MNNIDSLNSKFTQFQKLPNSRVNTISNESTNPNTHLNTNSNTQNTFSNQTFYTPKFNCNYFNDICLNEMNSKKPTLYKSNVNKNLFNLSFCLNNSVTTNRINSSLMVCDSISQISFLENQIKNKDLIIQQFQELLSSTLNLIQNVKDENFELQKKIDEYEIKVPKNKNGNEIKRLKKEVNDIGVKQKGINTTINNLNSKRNEYLLGIVHNKNCYDEWEKLISMNEDIYLLKKENKNNELKFQIEANNLKKRINSLKNEYSILLNKSNQ